MSGNIIHTSFESFSDDISQSRNPDEIFKYIESLSNKFKREKRTHTPISFVKYKDGLTTALNTSTIATFYVKYLKVHSKSSILLPIPANIDIKPYDTLFDIIKWCESDNTNELNISLFHAMCFQMMNVLLYEDYFKIKFKSGNAHLLINSVKVPTTIQEFNDLFVQFNDKYGDFRHILFFADSVPVVKTIENFIR